ncbi:MAG: ribosome biogenesis GTP-binding protein YihA/YsxC [Endozoicomonadaceae bacterium]|nr:ribosome biogenesis GTP-binding protein YihA/YsxC [Endozoicomonadaceae bacterium]
MSSNQKDQTKESGLHTQQKLNYKKAHFLISAAKLSQCPDYIRKEVAFAGRSNAGKSSALNALTGSSRLARTSKTPGRTRLINFFAIEKDLCLVDLPGYGYAKVSKSLQEDWGRHLEDYLVRRQSLAGIVLLMDIRHPLKHFDTAMLDWAKTQSLPVHILLTKADKLKYGAAKNALLNVKKIIDANYELVSIQIFSSLKKQGIETLCQQLDLWLT